jgi:hypothetical protein
MDTKLTLKLNENIIERAKKYASGKKMSLSKLIENYLDSLTRNEKDDQLEISPFVKSISTGKSLPANIDDKKAREDYLDSLDKKHQ